MTDSQRELLETMRDLLDVMIKKEEAKEDERH